MFGDVLKRYSKLWKSNSHCVFLIGEVGSSFENDDDALSVIDRLADAKFSAAKFQIVFADELLLPSGGKRMVEGKEVDLYHSFKQQERSFDFFLRLAKRCKERDLLFFASVFGPKSLDMLLKIGKEIGHTVVKLASPESHHLLLWREISKNIAEIDAVIFSTGMTTRKDLDWLRDFISKINIPQEKLCSLHCVTRYPATEQESNVSLSMWLKERYGFFSGLSDHSADAVFIPMLMAAYSGAKKNPCILEKHVSASNSLHLDSSVAINCDEFSHFVSSVHSAYLWGVEHGASKNLLKLWCKDYAKHYNYDYERVSIALGKESKSNEKYITQREKPELLATKRSLRCMKDKNKNDEIKLEDCSFLRPGALLAGEGYLWLDRLLAGQKLVAKLPIASGSALNKDCCQFVD